MARKKKMPKGKRETPLRIVYLLGAGATQAELMELSRNELDETFLEENSLLLANVSKRVCKAGTAYFTTQVRALLSPAGLSNIELFISLIEENHVESAAQIVSRLKSSLEYDILGRITPRRRQFYLHRALLEFHRQYDREELCGVISLNYDSLIDDACKVLGRKPDYCFSVHPLEGDTIPLLKLHGGFELDYRSGKLPIITPGVNKNYLELPYSFVWGRALELLIECDVLRVVGCSLSQNDLGVIDLLFKAHIARRTPPVLQLIDFDPPHNRIRENLGFFPRIERAKEIENNLISDITIEDPTKHSNPFKIWLKAKVERVMSFRQIRRTKYIRKVVESATT